MKILIRPEVKSDYPSITQVNDMAFGQENEGLLIESLRKRTEFMHELSLVALIEGQLVGHILFYPVLIAASSISHPTLSLSPMSVMPEIQSMGIGSSLIEAGFHKAVELGFHSVVVLGHKEYYPRFGFQLASQWKIKSPFDVPDEYSMAKELTEGALHGVEGIIQYPPEFYTFG
jgi:putative acetyltransferase